MFFLNNRPLFQLCYMSVIFIAGVHKCVFVWQPQNIFAPTIHDKIYSHSHMNNIHCFHMKNRSHFRYALKEICLMF